MSHHTDIFHYKKWTPFVPVPELHGKVFRDDGKVFVNSRYQVVVYEDDHPSFGIVVHLSIKSHEKDHRHCWRDFQRIKNELVGKEYEGIELYPAESRCVDGANQYHIFVFKSVSIPLGFSKRLVSEKSAINTKQRPFDDDNRPDDLTEVTEEMIEEAKKNLMLQMSERKERNKNGKSVVA